MATMLQRRSVQKRQVMVVSRKDIIRLASQGYSVKIIRKIDSCTRSPRHATRYFHADRKPHWPIWTRLLATMTTPTTKVRFEPLSAGLSPASLLGTAAITTKNSCGALFVCPTGNKTDWTALLIKYAKELIPYYIYSSGWRSPYRMWRRAGLEEG